MNINSITNLDLIALTENATELFKLPKYRDKGFVESFIGLATHRSGFYGVLYPDGTAVPLDKNQTSFAINEDVTLLIEGVVLLNDTPINIGSGNILYKGYGVLEIDNSVVYDGRGGLGGEVPLTIQRFIYNGDPIVLNTSKLLLVDLYTYNDDISLAIAEAGNSNVPVELEIVIFGYPNSADTISSTNFDFTGLFDPEKQNTLYLYFNPTIAGNLAQKIEASVKTKELFNFEFVTNVGDIDENTVTCTIPNLTGGVPISSDFKIYNETQDINHTITNLVIAGELLTFTITEPVDNADVVLLTYSLPSVNERRILVNNVIIPSQVGVLVQNTLGVSSLYDHFDTVELDTSKWSKSAEVTAVQAGSIISLTTLESNIFSLGITSTINLLSNQVVMFKGVNFTTRSATNRAGFGLRLGANDRYHISANSPSNYRLNARILGSNVLSNFETGVSFSAADDWKIKRDGDQIITSHWNGSSWVVISTITAYTTAMPIHLSIELGTNSCNAVFVANGDFVNNNP